MSACDRCYGNPCRCCAHGKPPGACVECASDDVEAQAAQIEDHEQRIVALEKLVAELEAKR